MHFYQHLSTMPVYLIIFEWISVCVSTLKCTLLFDANALQGVSECNFQMTFHLNFPPENITSPKWIWFCNLYDHHHYHCFYNVACHPNISNSWNPTLVFWYQNESKWFAIDIILENLQLKRCVSECVQYWTIYTLK